MTAPARTADSPSVPVAAAYGFMALPLAFAGLPLYIHVPDFYTREMGLGIVTAGFILFALRLLDAVQDPFIGYISDKSPALQRAVMAMGTLVLLLGMGALLAGAPSFVPVAHWFAGAVTLTALGLSMVNINLVTIGGMWSRSETARARLSGFREGFSLLGMLLAGILPALFMLSVSRAESFQYIYAVFAGLLLIGGVFFTLFYKRLPARDAILTADNRHKNARLGLVFFRRNAGFLAACFLTHIAASFPAVLFLYFVTDYLGAGEASGFFLLLYFLSGAGFMPLWIFLARKYSCRRAWLAGIMASVVAFMGAFALGPGDLWQFAAICVLSGAALGADLALPPVMMAGRLCQQKAERCAAQAYAVLNLMPKIALAAGTGVAFFLLGSAGFSPAADNPPGALWTLAMLYAVVPCLIKAMSALIVFNLGNGDLNDIQKRSFADGHVDGA